jgi:hypothetical protein
VGLRGENRRGRRVGRGAPGRPRAASCASAAARRAVSRRALPGRISRLIRPEGTWGGARWYGTGTRRVKGGRGEGSVHRATPDGACGSTGRARVGGGGGGRVGWGDGPPTGQRAVRALDVRVVLVHERAVEGLRTRSNAHTRHPLSSSAGGRRATGGAGAAAGRAGRRAPGTGSERAGCGAGAAAPPRLRAAAAQRRARWGGRHARLRRVAARVGRVLWAQPGRVLWAQPGSGRGGRRGGHRSRGGAAGSGGARGRARAAAGAAAHSQLLYTAGAPAQRSVAAAREQPGRCCAESGGSDLHAVEDGPVMRVGSAQERLCGRRHAASAQTHVALQMQRKGGGGQVPW